MTDMYKMSSEISKSYLSQAVDKVDFSNRLCHTAFYIPHREPKKEQFLGFNI